MYLTALLMAAPLALGDVEIEIIDKLISYYLLYSNSPLLSTHPRVHTHTHTCINSSYSSGGLVARSAEDNVVDESIPVDDQENGVAIGLGDACNCHKDRLQILKEGSKNEVEIVFLEDQRKETNDCDINECRRDAEMKRAIENNAQLMGRYEAEENAQREWEDKFKENSSCTPDSCEHGNRSDITEEMEELRETAESTHTIPSLGQGVTSEVEECRNIAEPMTKTLPNDLPTTCLDMETQISFAKFSFLNQESSGSTTKVKQIQEWSDLSSLGP